MKKRACLLFLSLFMACTQEKTITEDQVSSQLWTPEDRQTIISELNRTTNELRLEIAELTEAQWNFREDPDRWSIGEVVEHLEMQNQLHYREIIAISNTPQQNQFRSITNGQDAYFTKYSNDTTKSKAKWFLEPLGRFCTKAEGEYAFFRARGKLTKWVEQTEIDLRKQFTFRTPVTGKDLSALKIGQVRDLHQLLLIGIAHTDRHLKQIRKIKAHEDFPKRQD